MRTAEEIVRREFEERANALGFIVTCVEQQFMFGVRVTLWPRVVLHRGLAGANVYYIVSHEEILSGRIIEWAPIVVKDLAERWSQIVSERKPWDGPSAVT